MLQEFDIEDDLLEDQQLMGKYYLIEKIGEGCFGRVYKVYNKQSKMTSALKVQYLQRTLSTTKKRSLLSNQTIILSALQSTTLTPRLYAHGTWAHGNYIQIQLLQSDLSSLTQKKLKIQQLTPITIKLLNALMVLHNHEVIHQDIKPQNIMINKKGEYLFIDFGVSKILRQFDDNGQSNVDKLLKGFIGTPRYASIQAHNHLYQTKKDDLQSLMYLVAYLYYKKLPWMKIKCNNMRRMQLIQRTKQQTVMNIFRMMGSGFRKVFEYIKNLKPMQNPDYSYMIGVLKPYHSLTSFFNVCDGRMRDREVMKVSLNDGFKYSEDNKQANSLKNCGKFNTFKTTSTNNSLDQNDCSTNHNNMSDRVFNQFEPKVSDSINQHSMILIGQHYSSSKHLSESEQTQTKLMNVVDSFQPSIERQVRKFLSSLRLKNPFDEK